MSGNVREIEPHYLDDPDWDMARDCSEGGNWGFLFAHLILIAATFLGYIYLKPTPLNVIFPPPSAQIQPLGKYAFGWGPIPEGWNYNCINIDQVRKLVSGRPNCQ